MILSNEISKRSELIRKILENVLDDKVIEANSTNKTSLNFKTKCKQKSNVMNKSNLNQHSTDRSDLVEMLTNKPRNKLTKLNLSYNYSFYRPYRSKKQLRLDKRSLNKNSKLSRMNGTSITKSVNSKHITTKHITAKVSDLAMLPNRTNEPSTTSKQQVLRIYKVRKQKQFTIRCLLPFLMNLLISQLLFFDKINALDTCLEHCTCIYSKNKFIADCSALALDSLPIVKDEELATKVQILNLTRNAFVKLESEIFYTTKMINLQRIYLSKGSLQSIDNLTFYKLSNLVELDLSQNRLKSVPKDSFQSILKLNILDLSFNQIQVISEFSFHPLKMLKILSLENNQISVIDPKAFLGLVELETLKLSDNQISFMASESLSPLNKLHTLTLANNRWICDCKMRQLKEFLVNNRRINILDQPICDNQPQNIWTEISIDSFLCTPRLMQNNSDRIYQVAQGTNLALECSFQVESTLDSQPAVIRWLWNGNRPITNNSEGVVSSQRFLITEYDYYLTTETTSIPFTYNSTPSPSLQTKSSSSNNLKFPASNQLEIDDEDGLPLIELHDLNQFNTNQQPTKYDQHTHFNNEPTQRSTTTTAAYPSSNQLYHSHSIPPFERHIVKRRIRKSRMEITFILELNQGSYVCEASNRAGSVSLNFTIYVNSVIRRTDFIANNRPTSTTMNPAFNENNLVNKRSGELSSSDDALFNELNVDQNGQTKHQPLLNLNTSSSVVVGLILGILFGILLVLAVFSVLIVAICKKKPNDQLDLVNGTVNGNLSGQNSSTSTGCSTENSLLSTLAQQVNCLPANSLQTCSIGCHHPTTLSNSGSANDDWYSNNFSPNANSSNTYTNYLTSSRNNQNNFNNPLSIALHHSNTMSHFNSSNSLSMLSNNNLYGHCNLLTGHDQLIAGHTHLAPHHLINNTGVNTTDHCINGTLNVLNLETSIEKSELSIYNDDDLKKSKIA